MLVRFFVFLLTHSLTGDSPRKVNLSLNWRCPLISVPVNQRVHCPFFTWNSNFKPIFSFLRVLCQFTFISFPAANTYLSYYLNLYDEYPKRQPIEFYKKCTLKNFAKFTGKLMFWDLIFDKVVGVLRWPFLIGVTSLFFI